MHSGVYARHATESGIALCIGLEEALMVEQQIVRTRVDDFMVRSAVVVHPWQPVAYARQLMLMHSFSFLPVYF
jgi:predicted transcriptional regulator